VASGPAMKCVKSRILIPSRASGASEGRCIGGAKAGIRFIKISISH